MTYEEYIKPVKIDLGIKMEKNTLTFLELILFLLITINDKLKKE